MADPRDKASQLPSRFMVSVADRSSFRETQATPLGIYNLLVPKKPAGAFERIRVCSLKIVARSTTASAGYR